VLLAGVEQAEGEQGGREQAASVFMTRGLHVLLDRTEQGFNERIQVPTDDAQR
jgi:hypothetical protein